MAGSVCFVVAGGTTYSFPSVALTWDGVHQLFEVPLPKTLSPEMASEVGAIIKSLNIVTEGVRLVGNWKDGTDTALSRSIAFVNYFKTSPEPAVFTYGPNAEITMNVFLKEWHFDFVPGEGTMRQYNLVLSTERTTISESEPE
jgi:hypothetical protein